MVNVLKKKVEEYIKERNKRWRKSLEEFESELSNYLDDNEEVKLKINENE